MSAACSTAGSGERHGPGGRAPVGTVLTAVSPHRASELAFALEPLLLSELPPPPALTEVSTGRSGSAACRAVSERQRGAGPSPAAFVGAGWLGRAGGCAELPVGRAATYCSVVPKPATEKCDSGILNSCCAGDVSECWSLYSAVKFLFVVYFFREGGQT